ncbi:uncharacterized protein LOC126904747 [Daktulosphaira vitifoliae]|uniref:uncharacterized protein LOC126904747 n=1 Tax=Daktulosphaira vitifoliae TaxID=58002 RepID=UPI0021A9C14B|nr:uncharacterized protein LOC126904747 [Daktulosphaira vitifoliae]XP_050539922.1 uncharacterized protein LOC126904747 [Daktulosphaira vitifoliae]
MSVVLDDQYEVTINPFYKPHEPSDYQPFKTTVYVCAIFAVAIIALNVFFCCFSKHRKYWRNSESGNRYILPIWIKTPAKQAPLDLKELETNFSQTKPVYDSSVPQEFVELHKKESDI